jgi:hypothetical protein
MQALDYTTGKIADAAQRYDLILDIGGNPAPHGCAVRSRPPGRR